MTSTAMSMVTCATEIFKRSTHSAQFQILPTHASKQVQLLADRSKRTKRITTSPTRSRGGMRRDSPTSDQPATFRTTNYRILTLRPLVFLSARSQSHRSKLHSLAV